MSIVPVDVHKWLNEKYKKPKISPEWLEACYGWVITEKALNPATPGHQLKIQNEIEAQLLQSDLCDSTIPDTGLPADLSQQAMVTLRGPPILVEIIALTEIGHSAFSLQNARQARIDKADLTGLAADEAAEEDNPVQRYPRGTLRLELSDGTTTLDAFEFKPLPRLILGETPLGYKLLLKDVRVRRGIAFLEPKCVELKGFETTDREARQDSDFLRGLQLRLGREILPAGEPLPLGAPPEPAIQQPPTNARARPAQALNPAAEAGPSNPTRRVKKEPASTRPPNSTLLKSHFFSGPPASNPSAPIAKERLLSPRTMAANIHGREERTTNAKAESLPKGGENQREKQKATPGLDSDFGDDSMVLDDGFWEELDELEANALGRSDGKKASQSTTLTSGCDDPKTEPRASQVAITIDDSFEFDEDGWDVGREDFCEPVKFSPAPNSQHKTNTVVKRKFKASDNDDVIEISD